MFQTLHSAAPPFIVLALFTIGTSASVLPQGTVGTNQVEQTPSPLTSLYSSQSGDTDFVKHPGNQDHHPSLLLFFFSRRKLTVDLSCLDKASLTHFIDLLQFGERMSTRYRPLILFDRGYSTKSTVTDFRHFEAVNGAKGPLMTPSKPVNVNLTTEHLLRSQHNQSWL